MTDDLLMIFVKNVVEGRVKTRLARSVGAEKAVDIYRRLLDYTREVVSPLGCHKQVWYSRAIENDDGWTDCEKKRQQGEGLGERMSYAFRAAFEAGYEKAVIIGSDCATIETSLIEKAFEELEDSDIVLGPSRDGGYYLLGMKSYHPQLFEEIDWSTGKVLRQTLERVKSRDHSYELLTELNDVDTLADWREVAPKFRS